MSSPLPTLPSSFFAEPLFCHRLCSHCLHLLKRLSHCSCFTCICKAPSVPLPPSSPSPSPLLSPLPPALHPSSIKFARLESPHHHLHPLLPSTIKFARLESPHHHRYLLLPLSGSPDLISLPAVFTFSFLIFPSLSRVRPT